MTARDALLELAATLEWRANQVDGEARNATLMALDDVNRAIALGLETDAPATRVVEVVESVIDTLDSLRTGREGVWGEEGRRALTAAWAMVERSILPALLAALTLPPATIATHAHPPIGDRLEAERASRAGAAGEKSHGMVHLRLRPGHTEAPCMACIAAFVQGLTDCHVEESPAP